MKKTTFETLFNQAKELALNYFKEEAPRTESQKIDIIDYVIDEIIDQNYEYDPQKTITEHYKEHGEYADTYANGHLLHELLDTIESESKKTTMPTKELSCPAEKKGRVMEREITLTNTGRKPREATKKYVVAYTPKTHYWVYSYETDDFQEALSLAGNYISGLKLVAKIYVRAEKGYMDMELL